MAIAHVCLGCGHDLARMRTAAHPDPHYGLPLTVCPQCGRAEFRWRHPLVRGWRRARRIFATFAALILCILVLLLFTMFSFIAAFGEGARLIEQRHSLDLDQDRFSLFWAYLVFPLILGVWLEAAFNHWRYRLQWLAWAAWIISLAWILPLAEDISYGQESSIGVLVKQHWYASCNGMLALLLITCISLIGIPFGRMLRRALDASRRTRWRRKRARIRRSRTG